MNTTKVLQNSWRMGLAILAVAWLAATETRAVDITVSGKVTHFDGTAYPGVRVDVVSAGSSAGISYSWYWGYTDGSGN